jgi:hypothetical protein
MRPIGWLIFIPFSLVVALVLVVQITSHFSFGYLIFDLFAIACYFMMYLFYGSKRSQTLQSWLPVKAKLAPYAKGILLLFASFSCVYYAAQAMLTHNCSAFAPGSSLQWRWVDQLLQGSCERFGPIVPSSILFATGIYCIYLVIQRRRLGA